MSSAEKEFPGLRFDPAPGLLPALALPAEKVRQASGQVGNVRTEMEKTLRDPGAWSGLAGGSCHDAVQHIYPEVWIMHDALSGVERTIGEWSFLLAEYQRSRTELEAQAVAARARVKQMEGNPDVDLRFFEVMTTSGKEQEALLTRHAEAKKALEQAEDDLDAILDSAKDLKRQHDESARGIAKRIREIADHPPDRNTTSFGGSNLIPPYFTKPPVVPEDTGPKREFNVTDPTARDRATELAAMAMVAAQDGYFGNDRAASYMKYWLEGDGRDIQFDAQEFLKADPGFRKILNDTMRANAPSGNFDTGWKGGSVARDMQNGPVTPELQDFYYTMNGYQYRIVGTDFKMVEGHPAGTIRVDIYKRYNWGNPEGGAHRNDIEGVPQNDLARLNETGLAHDFDIVGSTTWYMAPGLVG
ncbi:hypothetical protein [Embleya sp. NPDC059237]|uniref:hypothetical protein n=1 Tax=Embleya sp. NPDC059237 TaxID=3346784 RepID=UPI00369E4334